MDPKQQVIETERAFAKTLADRDYQAFLSYLSEEATFLSGTEVLRGRKQVGAGWKPFFDAPRAPFSWKPEKVEVLPSGDLALSTGPVHSSDGKPVAEFTSIWRLEAPGVWRIIFDRGNKLCD